MIVLVSTAALRGLRLRRALSLGLVAGLGLGILIEALIVVFPALVREGPRPDLGVLAQGLPWAGGAAGVMCVAAGLAIWFTQRGKLLPTGTGSTLVVPNLLEVAISGGTVAHPENNWAIFIDLSNVALGESNSATLSVGELERTLDWLERTHDRLLVRQAYGDYSAAMPGGGDLGVELRRRGFTLAHMPRMQRGAEKNHSDIQLAVDAALIARSRPDIGGFIILGGDGDYTPLLLQLRTLGRRIHIVARERTTSQVLVAQADAFITLESISGRNQMHPTALREALVKLRSALTGLAAQQIAISTIALPALLKSLGMDVTAFGFLDAPLFLNTMTGLGVLRVNQAEGSLTVIAGDIAPGSDALDRLLLAMKAKVTEFDKRGQKPSLVQVLEPILKADPELDVTKKTPLVTIQILHIAERLGVVNTERVKPSDELRLVAVKA